MLPIYAARLAGRSFAVRCGRSRRHPFTSLDVEVLSVPLAHGTIIDIRRPYDEERAPLQLHVPVLKIPFYELYRRAAELDPGSACMLYCGKGTMSRFHARHLNERNSLDIKVYAP